MTTIGAIATANGIGAISIVRLSGPEAYPIAQKLLSPSSSHPPKKLIPRVATLSKIYTLSGELIDIGIVIYFKSPYSFTGEDVVEFQCHGGIGVTSLILEELLKGGATLAQPGEFTKRAFLNGKIDLSQAEAIAKLIESRSQKGVKFIARQLSGELKRFVEEIRHRLIELMAYSEVSIDYGEEDLPDHLEWKMKQKLNQLEEILTEMVEGSRRRRGALIGYKVAIIGKPNVGKSSILNRLLNQNRAIVSSIAGTTRDTIEEDLLIGTHLIRIVDTAGIREAENEIEKIGVERSKQAIEEADLILFVVDSSDFGMEDRQLFQMVAKSEKEVIVVANKMDLNPDFRANFNFPLVKISAKKTIVPLVEKLESILNQREGSEDLILISQRQIGAVEKCQKEVGEARLWLEKGELELFSYHIREAIETIGSISRPFEYDEMLDSLFSNFCVGK